MRSSRNLWLIPIMLALVASCSLCADLQPKKVESVDDFSRQYGFRSSTTDGRGVRYFYGGPKGEASSGKTQLQRFDPKTLEVSLAVPSGAMEDLLSGGGSLDYLSVDAAGKTIATTICRKTIPASGGWTGDIVSIDLVEGKARALLADGQRNYGVNISPDGKYIAFFATDPQEADGLPGPIRHSAGKIVDVQTKKVLLVTDYFVDASFWSFSDPPRWLDETRVLFTTISTDRAFFGPHVKPDEQIVRYSGVEYCPYVAVASPSRGKTARLFMPGGSRPPQCTVDTARKKVLLSDISNDRRQVILDTDFDLVKPTELVAADGAQKIHSVSLEGGELSYTCGQEKRKTTLK